MGDIKKKIEMAPMFISVDDSRPFEGMLISEEWRLLKNIESRTPCKVCKKSRKYFCYTCYIPLPGLEIYVPKIKLPIKIDIIKHAREKSGKSTAIHAAVIAPEDVTIYIYPNIPAYEQEQNVVLIFPGKNALSIEDIISLKEKSEKATDVDIQLKGNVKDTYIKRAVFIDSTWNQTSGIYKDPRLRVLPCVVLRSRISQFWRYQSGSPRWYLSTIEAVHQFVIELECILRTKYWIKTGETTHEISDNDSETRSQTIAPQKQFYSREYDNLLFFFRFMYDKIHTMHNHDDLMAYKRSLN